MSSAEAGHSLPLLSPSQFSSQYALPASSATRGHDDRDEHSTAVNGSASGPSTTAVDKPVRFPPPFAIPGPRLALFFLLVGVAIALAFTVLREPLENIGISSSDLLKYGSIPVVSVAFTYLHIWLALWMTFYPLDFFGICQIPGTNVGVPGWQGIIPFKAEKMARMAVQLMTSKLIDVREVFGRLRPEQVAAEMGPALHATLDEVISAVAQAHSPDLWALLPARVRAELVTQAHEDAPPAIAQLMQQMQMHIHELFDLEDMVVQALVKDRELLNNIFIACGRKELEFIRNSGAYMGGAFGLLQMLLWMLYANKWLLPGFGFVVGVLTNWLALKMIFEPVRPRYPFGRTVCCCAGPRTGDGEHVDPDAGVCKIQGLFLRRQREVAAVYAETIAKKVLTSKNLLTALIAGPLTDRLFLLVHSHVARVVDDFAGPMGRPLLQIGVGLDRYAAIQADACARFLERLPPLLLSLEKYTDRALEMERTIREKMECLPPEEFEGLLHPVFAEDEWKLVLMGGVLGIVIGLAQIELLGA